MEEHIGGLDIWDEYGGKFSCKGMEMLEDTSHAEERHNCVEWQPGYDSSQGPIGRTLLQVEDDRSGGIHDFLGAYGGITTFNWQAPLAMGTYVGAVVEV